jgi:hypothetical protein
MYQVMRILAEDFVYALVSQSAEAGWVAERAPVFEVNPINGFGGRIEKKSEFVLALAQRLFCQLSRCDVACYPRNAHRSAI